MNDHQVRLGLRLKEAVRDALMRAPAMSDPATRTMYVTELQAELGEALVIQRYPDAHHDIWSIITACETHSSGLSSLSEVVTAILGRGQHADKIRDIIAQASSGESPDTRPDGQILARHQRSALIDIVSTLHLERADRIWRAMFSPSTGDSRPPDSAAQLIQRAERAAAEREGVLTVLAYVDRLAHATDFEVRDALHEWVDAVAAGLNIPTTTVRQLCTSTDLNIGAGGYPSGANSGVSELLNVAQEGNLSESPDFDPGDVMGPAVVAPPILQQESVRLIWGGVPLRNPDFVGRGEYLANLSQALSAETRP